MKIDSVHFEELQGTGGDLGVIVLNRPEVLNSLNHEMIIAIHKELNKWAEAKNIKAVVIKAVPDVHFVQAVTSALSMSVRVNTQSFNDRIFLR